MKKQNETITPHKDGDLFARATPVEDGIWMNGFYENYVFEAKIRNDRLFDGINGGRVTNLIVTALYYTDDNSFRSEIARYCGEWNVRPRDSWAIEKIDALVSLLDDSPHQQAYSSNRKQTA